MTRSRRAKAKPRQKAAMMTVSVHWTFGVKSPVQRKISEISAPGTADANAIRRILLSWLNRGSLGFAVAIVKAEGRRQKAERGSL